MKDLVGSTSRNVLFHHLNNDHDLASLPDDHETLDMLRDRGIIRCGECKKVFRDIIRHLTKSRCAMRREIVATGTLISLQSNAGCPAPAPPSVPPIDAGAPRHHHDPEPRQNPAPIQSGESKEAATFSIATRMCKIPHSAYSAVQAHFRRYLDDYVHATTLEAKATSIRHILDSATQLVHDRRCWRGGGSRRARGIARALEDIQQSASVSSFSCSAPEAMDPVARRARRAQRFVCEGYLSKAAAAATAMPLAPADEDTLEALKQLHPPQDTTRPIPPCPLDAPELPTIDDALFRRVVRRLNSGAAGGPSGLNGDMVHILSRCDICATGLKMVMKDIINGHVDEEIAHRLRSSLLVAVSKDPTSAGQTRKIRPVAVPEVLYRLAAAYVGSLVATTAATLLKPVQLGVGIPGGSEAALHRIQSTLEACPENILIQIDFENAFNRRNRADVLEALFAKPELNTIWRIVSWAYGTPSRLLFPRPTGAPSVLHSAAGVRQGDPLSSLLYALSMQDIYLRTQEAAQHVQPSAVVAAIMDDVSIIGSREAAAAGFDAIADYASDATLGIRIRTEKCFVLSTQRPPPHDLLTASSARALSVVGPMVPLLGSLVGDRTSAVVMLADGTESMHRDDWLRHNAHGPLDSLLECLRHPQMSAQAAFQCFRMCVGGRPLHFLRTLPPVLTDELAKDFDDTVWNSFACKLQISVDARGPQLETVKKTTYLPLRLGGLGVTSAQTVSAAAYVSSVALTYPFIHYTAAGPTLPIMEHAIEALKNFVDCKMDGVDFTAPSVTTLRQPSEKVKVQKAFAVTQQEKVLAAILGATPARADMPTRRLRAARMASRAPMSSCWLTALPTSYDLRIPDPAFCFALRLRLGLSPLELLPDMPCWLCKRDIAGDQFHSLTCIARNVPNSQTRGISLTSPFRSRHDAVVGTLRRVLDEMGFECHVEPAGAFTSSEKRPDILLQLPLATGGTLTVLGDVSITHPLCTTGIVQRKADIAILGAAKRVERCKTLKYHDESARAGAKFFPLVIETLGGVGESFRTFIAFMLSQARDLSTRDPHVLEAMQYSIWHRLAAAHARANYKVHSSFHRVMAARSLQPSARSPAASA